MKKTIMAITTWLVKSLNSMASWLESKNCSSDMQSKFVDLAPTDEADKDGIYSEAIQFATNNAKVSNIALTGPYGAGKSSIIQSFLKKYRRPALHISLAAFVPDSDVRDKKVSRQELEISILQQMLYGADANKLPLSRFKRIQSPSGWAFLKSLFIMLGFLALWYVFHQRVEIISGTFFAPISFSAVKGWFNLGICVLAAIFLWTTLHHFYVASFGLSLKSISLKDVEIKPANDDQASIMNRHLDEIVYFFQSTKYDLVIIEDLDRFDDAEIFVNLREINKLVNENAGVKRTVRFLYALRDDMFANTDRTKFFEFIIPVIPIINTSNSIDMVLKQARRLKLDNRLEQQFLREVSRYLNDLRLIQNIFNEYAIYLANLENEEEDLLNPNKLLAILIYKNVYPSDFELLHRGEGTLAKILKRQDELIGDGETTYRAEIAELEKQLEVAEQQTPSDLKELRQIYAMALIEILPGDVHAVGEGQQELITPFKLASHKEFERIIESPTLSYLKHSGYHNRRQSINISNLQNEVNSQKSYKLRKLEIENKAVDNKNKSLRRISELRSKIAALRSTKFKELLRLNIDRVPDHFEDFGKNGELARFLIMEGHLDDTYYQYTSLFHSGRLSPNDNKFLIQIRAFITPEPGFPIDNPKEVIEAMRGEDFRQSYVLNVKLVDSLLGDQKSYGDQTQKLFELLSSEFERCESFFDAYYTSGRDITGLLSGLSGAWEGLVPAAIASTISTPHVTRLVTNLPETLLKKLAERFDELSEFVSENLQEILVNSPELAPQRLTYLDFEVKDLETIKEHPEIVRFMFEKGRFELTIPNLEYAYQVILGKNDLKLLRERNFTTIRSINSETLMNRVERDFDRYLHDILLGLQGNSKEDASAILAVVRNNTLDKKNLREFLNRQTTLLPSLENVPDGLHAMLFELNLIEPTWENCLAFIDTEGFNKDSLVEYLDQDGVRETILQTPISSDSDLQNLGSFLLRAGSLTNAAYREYVQALPQQFNNFPEVLEIDKRRILINEEKIIFTTESLDALADNSDLQVFFVKANIDKYLEDPDSFALDEVFLEGLLRSEIDDESKLKIVRLMDLKELINLPDRAALIGPIIQNTDVEMFDLDRDIVRSLIEHSRPIETQITLLNKWNDHLDDDDVRQVLTKLPRPFSEIKTGYDTPKLENNSKNLELVKWLDSRNIISSWRVNDLSNNDIKVNLRRSL